MWWRVLSGIAMMNIVLWLTLGLRAKAALNRQTVLCGIYVFVCAFRSFLPRADVQRFCLVDSWWSTVFVGRSVATVGELAFMAQAAAFLYLLGQAAGSRAAMRLAQCVVPIIALAECCSWYAVITTNFIGNTCEESLWAIAATVLLAGFISVWPKAPKPVLISSYVAIPAYIAFMMTVDVPMYFNRWRADLADGKQFFGLSDGLHDLTHRWVVTFSWADWSTEIPWMTAYFSFAVWLSLAMMVLSRRFATRFEQPSRS